MSSPSTKTSKRLFALSGNICAFPKCIASLVDEDSGSVIGEICHIKGKKPNSPRYDASQMDEERDAFENLILMCSIHHKVIDDDEESYTVERLLEIKSKHESRPSVSEHLTASQQKLEQLLESHLISILEDKKQQKILRTQENQENSDEALSQVERMQKELEYKEFRKRWFDSENSVLDTSKAVMGLFDGFEQIYFDNEKAYKSLLIGIRRDDLESERTFFINFREALYLRVYLKLHYTNSIEGAFLQITIYWRRDFNNPIRNDLYKPDVDIDKEVVWQKESNKSQKLTSSKIATDYFQLFMNQVDEIIQKQ